MKIITINLGNFGSTGNIIKQVGSIARDNGIVYISLFPGSKQNSLISPCDYVIQNEFFRRLTLKISHVFGMNGLLSIAPTIKVLKFLDAETSIVHLHNLHDSYINLPLLFNHIKKHNITTIWTLHDCWSFTGHCPHFTMVNCDKWKTGCYNCPQYREYPQSLIDNSKLMWKLKKKWFTGVENLTIVTPSQWLADLVKQSYLKDYPIKVIHNGIDLSAFKPTESAFRDKYHIAADRSIILGVSFGWSNKKGLDVFIELAKKLDTKRYLIVLVGTNDSIDTLLPENVLSIHRTHNQSELAEIYSAADLFVNPTREDNYPTVNMEAIACGTPVLTFRTGGSPEIIDETCGAVVDFDDIDAMEKEIIRICRDKPYTKEACLEKAKSFDMNDRYIEYLELYKCLTLNQKK